MATCPATARAMRRKEEQNQQRLLSDDGEVDFGNGVQPEMRAEKASNTQESINKESYTSPCMQICTSAAGQLFAATVTMHAYLYKYIYIYTYTHTVINVYSIYIYILCTCELLSVLLASPKSMDAWIGDRSVAGLRYGIRSTSRVRPDYILIISNSAALVVLGTLLSQELSEDLGAFVQPAQGSLVRRSSELWMTDVFFHTPCLRTVGLNVS